MIRIRHAISCLKIYLSRRSRFSGNAVVYRSGQKSKKLEKLLFKKNSHLLIFQQKWPTPMDPDQSWYILTQVKRIPGLKNRNSTHPTIPAHFFTAKTQKNMNVIWVLGTYLSDILGPHRFSKLLRSFLTTSKNSHALILSRKSKPTMDYENSAMPAPLCNWTFFSNSIRSGRKTRLHLYCKTLKNLKRDFHPFLTIFRKTLLYEKMFIYVRSII